MPEVTINIASRTYRLAVSSGEENLIRDCAEKVDQQIASLKESANIISQEQIAVLAALEIAYEAQKKTDEDMLAARKAEEAAVPAVPTEELLASIEEKDREIASLKEKVADLQKQVGELSSQDADSLILKEIDDLSSQCEKAIYSDMHKIGIF